MTGLLSLKQEKHQELLNLLDIYSKCKWSSSNQLESLAGKLCWAAHVVPYGAHISSIFNWFRHWSHQITSAAQVTGDVTGWTVDSTDDIFGPPSERRSMYRMPVPKLAELSATVTGFMCSGKMACQASLSIISTPKNLLQLSWRPKCDTRTGPITIFWSTKTIKWPKQW